MSASREPQINLKELPGVRGERGPAVAVRRPGRFTAAASRRPTAGSSHNGTTGGTTGGTTAERRGRREVSPGRPSAAGLRQGVRRLM